MTWNLETSTLTRSIPLQPDGPVPIDRFASTIERHEQLALALQRARREPIYKPHPPHQYTEPTLINSNVSINRYLTDSDQKHEYLAYMLERDPARQAPPEKQQGNNSSSRGSSISLDDVLSAVASHEDGDDQQINQGATAETRLKKLV